MRSVTDTGSRTTIRDVARLAGVSVATVSRVLNDRPDVSDVTREAVLKVVRAHGFTSNRNARALSSGSTGLIGVTVPVLHAEYFTAILAGAAEALYERDMRVLLCPTQHSREREIGLVERLMQGTTDGALLVLPTESTSELTALNRRGYRLVVIDPRLPLDDDVPSVSATHGRGASQATEHLLELGHTRIGIITGPEGWVASQERLRGHQAAMAGAGLLTDPALVMRGDFEPRGGFDAAAQLLSAAEAPTAIFAFNDAMAIGATQAAQHRGLRVPGDVSIVGFDDTASATIVTPPLTTVRQPLAEMGRTAVSLLLRLLNGDRVEALRVELATKLIVRATTAAPRAH